MPAIPVKRAWRGVHGSNIDLIILVFGEEINADEATQAITRLSTDWQFVMLNSAVLVKDLKGKTAVKEFADVDAKHGAIFGAITGGLIGLLRGPTGAIIGMATGAVSRNVAARLIDMGFPDEEMQKLQDSLQPGNSALIVMLENIWVNRVLEKIGYLNGELWMHKNWDESVEQYLERERK